MEKLTFKVVCDCLTVELVRCDNIKMNMSKLNKDICDS